MFGVIESTALERPKILLAHYTISLGFFFLIAKNGICMSNKIKCCMGGQRIEIYIVPIKVHP